ncbi:MAG: protein-L-isoaspartate(D-aspartate) O-methyltransferase [archaeon]
MSVNKEALIEYWTINGILKDKKVIAAFEKTGREKFVLPEYIEDAYLDEPLPLVAGQTISQPTTVAIMTDALELKPGHKVLEIGSGSGYQAAIISEIVGAKGKVFTIERISALAKFAKNNLKSYKNVSVIHADGTKGYSKEMPYDRIIVTAAAANLPAQIFDCLKDRGVMVIPIEDHLFRIRKLGKKAAMEDLGLFAFVPLIPGAIEF